MLGKDKFIPNPEYGDLFTIESFNEDVNSGCLIDYDGIGYYATAKKMNRAFPASPGMIRMGEKPPKWATHVMWFNR